MEMDGLSSLSFGFADESSSSKGGMNDLLVFENVLDSADVHLRHTASDGRFSPEFILAVCTVARLLPRSSPSSLFISSKHIDMNSAFSPLRRALMQSML